MSTEPQAPAPRPVKRLVRTRDDQMIAGVCGGLARYLGVDPTLVRVAAVIALVFAFPAALVGYLLAWAIMPSETWASPRRESSTRAFSAAVRASSITSLMGLLAYTSRRIKPSARPTHAWANPESAVTASRKCSIA